MKQPKLIDHYTIHEIHVGMARILSLSEQVIRNQNYTIEQISARLSLNENLVRSIMNILTEQGLYKYSARNDTYHVPGDLK